MEREDGKRDALTERVRNFMEEERMAEAGSTIVAGVSGGADSVCLLHVLLILGKEYGWSIAVVHVDHGIRREAAEDARYVEGLCRSFSVPFYLKEADVEGLAREWGMSVEEAGRRVRYGAFGEAAEKFGADRIAVAHNRNDRAETLLFHLFRGTGLAGMGSIRPVRGRIIRPLLCLGREEIEAWLLERQIAWRIDESNMADTYTRNRIRNHILPYAREEICNGADVHLAQAASLLADTADYVGHMTREALGRCLRERSADGVVIDAAAFLREESLLWDHMVLEVLKELSQGGRDVGMGHVRAVRGLFGNQSGRRVLLPYGLEAVRNFDCVICRKAGKKAGMTQTGQDGSGGCGPQGGFFPEEGGRDGIRPGGAPDCFLPPEGIDLTELVKGGGQAEIWLPGWGILGFSEEKKENLQGIPQKTYTKWFDHDKIESLVVRSRRPGDYLVINEMLQKKSLKEYLIQEKVPVWERDRLPLLADGHHVLWVVGHRISSAVKVREDTKRVLRVHIRGGKEDG